MRRRYRQDPVTLEMVEIPINAAPRSVAPFVWDDLPGYDSPVTGEWIEGRKQRREDLRRHGCRPYEGREQEQKEVDRIRADRERKLDGAAERMAQRGWAQLAPAARKILRGD